MYNQNNEVTALSKIPYIIKCFFDGKDNNKTKNVIVQEIIKNFKDSKYMNDMSDSNYVSWDFIIEPFINSISEIFDDNLEFDKQKFFDFLSNNKYVAAKCKDDKLKILIQVENLTKTTNEDYDVLFIDSYKIKNDLKVDSEKISKSLELDIKKAKHLIMNRIINAKSPDMKYPINNDDELAKAIVNSIKRIFSNTNADTRTKQIINNYNYELIQSIFFIFKFIFSKKEQDFIKNKGFDKHNAFDLANKYADKYIVKNNIDFFIDLEKDSIIQKYRK